MNLNVSKRGARTYLYIEKKFWDKQNRKTRSVNVRTLGYLDVLQKDYPDPIAHFKQMAKDMTLEEQSSRTATLTIDMTEKLAPNTMQRYNLGYAVILNVFHALELDRFLKNKQRNEAFEYNTYSIMQMLVISRILSPGSKRKAFMEKGRYFERFEFELEDVYHSLTHFARIATETQRWMSEKVAVRFGRDTRVIYYDVTNFYFEIDEEDDMRRRGKSKEGRKDPIVQMGLAMDADGIPLHYELFPGNTLDKQTFQRVIGEVRCNYETGRIIAVADMGITTGDNIYYLKGGDRDARKNGYIFSFSVRGGTDQFKHYVLEQDEYRTREGAQIYDTTEYKVKSRLTPRDIYVTSENGSKTKKLIDEKQVIFWSRKYAEKAKVEREAVLKKAHDIIAHPGKYTKHGAYGADKYVKGISYDKATGEVIKSGQTLSFNAELLAEDEKYDGYYSIVTSELDMSEQDIIETYRGLWEIEETFRVSKGTLEFRPVYVSDEEHIKAHILICFIGLVILRLIQKKVRKKMCKLYSAQQTVDAMNQISCSLEEENIYLFDSRNEVIDGIGQAFGIDFTRKRLSLGAIKKVLAQARRQQIS